MSSPALRVNQLTAQYDGNNINVHPCMLEFNLENLSALLPDRPVPLREADSLLNLATCLSRATRKEDPY